MISGETALAYGVLEAQPKLVIGTPGSPGAKTIEYIINQSQIHSIEIQWMYHEQWALEEALGASLAGSRVFVALKPAPFLKAFESLQNLFITNVRAGLVILLGDNQDSPASLYSREFSYYDKFPFFEPASPTEGREMVLEAFRMSEEYELPVLIRINSSFLQTRESVSRTFPPFAEQAPTSPVPLKEIPNNLFSNLLPQNSHEQLARRLSEIGQLFELSPFNHIEGKGRIGIIAVGIAYSKIVDVLKNDLEKNFSILKLGTLNPIPLATAGYFLENVETALVLEENAPIMEKQIQKLAKYQGISIKILGRYTKHVPWEKILYHWQIEEILATLQPAFRKKRMFYPFQKDRLHQTPKRLCGRCLINELFEIFETLSAKDKIDNPNTASQIVIVKDNICQSLEIVKNRFSLIGPYHTNTVVGIATGIAKAQPRQTVVALLDARAFIHSGINSLIHTAQVRSNLLVILIDQQPIPEQRKKQNPGRKEDIASINLPIENLINLCHVSMFRIFDTQKSNNLEHEIEAALQAEGLRVILIKVPCNSTTRYFAG